MSNATPGQAATFGYLSMLESMEHGFFGGYLVVSALGRPLEFHCTAPVRPNRAQQILYGPTLHPYLLGEQIGGTLLAAAKLTPQVILTDQLAALPIRSRVKTPMAFIELNACEASAMEFDGNPSNGCLASSASIQPAITETVRTGTRFSLGAYELQLPLGHESDQTVVVNLLNILAEYVDLGEPFGRIHDAIREAQRISGHSDESHGQAA